MFPIERLQMGKHNQIGHILIDRQRHSSVLDVQSFRAADCDSDYYLVVAKVRQRLAVNKQRTHRLHMERKIGRGQRSIMLSFQIGLQLWKSSLLRWKLVVLEKRLDEI
jgi:hypothetical protein